MTLVILGLTCLGALLVARSASVRRMVLSPERAQQFRPGVFYYLAAVVGLMAVFLLLFDPQLPPAP